MNRPKEDLHETRKRKSVPTPVVRSDNRLCIFGYICRICGGDPGVRPHCVRRDKCGQRIRVRPRCIRRDECGQCIGHRFIRQFRVRHFGVVRCIGDSECTFSSSEHGGQYRFTPLH